MSLDELGTGDHLDCFFLGDRDFRDCLLCKSGELFLCLLGGEMSDELLLRSIFICGFNLGGEASDEELLSRLIVGDLLLDTIFRGGD